MFYILFTFFTTHLFLQTANGRPKGIASLMSNLIQMSTNPLEKTEGGGGAAGGGGVAPGGLPEVVEVGKSSDGSGEGGSGSGEKEEEEEVDRVTRENTLQNG